MVDYGSTFASCAVTLGMLPAWTQTSFVAVAALLVTVVTPPILIIIFCLPLLFFPGITSHFPLANLDFSISNLFLVCLQVCTMFIWCELNELDCIEQLLKRWNGCAQFTQVNELVTGTTLWFDPVSLNLGFFIVCVLHRSACVSCDLNYEKVNWWTYHG